MSKRDAMELENSRKFMAELVNEFMSSAELYEMSVETACGTVTLSKYDSPNKIGFKPNGDKQN